MADAAADARFGGTESVARHRLREVICVPLKGRHDTVGALFLDAAGDSGPRFHADHLLLAAALGHQAAVAVEETRHYHALLAAERLAAVGQAMAALSHHVKNIMQGVRFGGDLVRMGLAGDDRPLLEKGWSLVERNQRRIDDLILDMLGYSKEREPGAEPVELGALARDALELVAGRAADIGAELRFAAPPHPVTVSGDPEGFHRALLNVVSNALDAVESSDVKLVEVALTATGGGGAELAVRDTGPGIDPELAEDIFKPFVSTKGSRGTGLGLPVSRKTMREHDGDLTATRWSEGGSEFVLRFAGGGRSCPPHPACATIPPRASSTPRQEAACGRSSRGARGSSARTSPKHSSPPVTRSAASTASPPTTGARSRKPTSRSCGTRRGSSSANST